MPGTYPRPPHQSRGGNRTMSWARSPALPPKTTNLGVLQVSLHLQDLIFLFPFPTLPERARNWVRVYRWHGDVEVRLKPILSHSTVHRRCGFNMRGPVASHVRGLSSAHYQSWGAPKSFFASLEPILEGLQEEQLILLKRSFKLRELHTDDIAGFLVKPICSFLSSSLTALIFGFNENKEDEQVERFTEEQEEAFLLLTSLQFLEFTYSGELQCLPAGLHRLTNLKTLRLIVCPSIQSLPKGGLPSSLQELDVSNCKNLQCLPAGIRIRQLTNLKTLKIWNCASMLSLPKNGIPSSLEQLNVGGCCNENLMQSAAS
ncbi:hypothetical protein GUJ93_ZPchr0458g22731 [Zizania palustris]|uniref:NBS-LRR n=1 Tax=Zizania palustris TaxID=103762 RepID=A0A8J5RBT5_ZIZPA|nr:hypothetical protein GUJ93_ZPchr0458g22731 [Zizania palustris]